MSLPADIPARVTRLEHQMAEVRFLAAKAESDAADCKSVLHGQTGVLNAIRKDQVAQAEKIAVMDAKIDDGFARVDTEMRDGFARVDTEMRDGFARVDAEARKNYAMLAHGQERITELLTRQLGEEPNDDE
jgi:hypothetical protein